jgi:hypothetical protein
MKDSVKWTTPSPLWENAIRQNIAGLRHEELLRPAVLRFATDDFMDVFMQMLAHDPLQLKQFIAQPETWRGISNSPDLLKPAPRFAQNFQRLGLISRRAKNRNSIQNVAAVAENPSQNPLKLYQPAHQRFYLIASCLVCERPGLPDKSLDSGREEKATFVIRRLFPPNGLKVSDKLPPLDSTWEEYAYVLTDQGAKWKKINGAKDKLIEAEEQLPLFAVNFTEDDGRRRKLYASVIPAGQREAYMAAGSHSANVQNPPPNPDDLPADSRTYLMRKQFRDPWKSLLQSASTTKSAISQPPPPSSDANQLAYSRADLLKNSREQIQTVSWLLLLDFAKFLEKEINRVWRALKGETVTPALDAKEAKLKKLIEDTVLDNTFKSSLLAPIPVPPVPLSPAPIPTATVKITDVKLTLKDALLAILPANETTAKQIEKGLETVRTPYDRITANPKYPNFLFPLADALFDMVANPSLSLKTKLDGVNQVAITPSNFNKAATNKGKPRNARIKDGEDYVNEFARIVQAALPTLPPTHFAQPVPLASQTPLDMREGWFLIRCVYERPLCGTIDPPVLSKPTKPFQIAGFFDPDAPARPIRIALPIDTSPAGLRKFDKNTAFMMSDLLCGQVNRMKGITFADLVLSVLPFPFHKSLSVPDPGGCDDEDGLSIGMMCSLSIPIITICALILLMIIVSLLDFIFRWIPFFIICFPLPGLRGKEDE